MNNQIKKIYNQNKELEKKLNKYKHSYFSALFLLSISLSYFICQIFHLDDSIYIRLFPEISNSFTFTMMSAIISGSILGTCKLEYIKAAKKIENQLEKNKRKIEILKTKQPLKKKQINSKKFEQDLSEIKKNIELSVEEIISKKETNKLEEEYQLIEQIDMEKIKQKVYKKRMGK